MKRFAGVVLLLSVCLFFPSALFAQDGYDPISAEELREVLEDVKSWAAETSIFRENAKKMNSSAILEQADAIRKKFDPVMVLIATTEPEAEYKPAAVMLLMGTKGVELALWHYMYAILGNSQRAMEHGDVILSAAVNQLLDAEKLFGRLP